MDKNVSEKILREFGILIGLMFPFILGFLLPFIRGHSFNFWTLYISFPFIFLGLINFGCFLVDINKAISGVTSPLGSDKDKS